MKYADLVLANKISVDEIDNFVELWHKSDSGESIYTFLGLSVHDYALWLQNNNYLYGYFEQKRIELRYMEGK